VRARLILAAVAALVALSVAGAALSGRERAATLTGSVSVTCSLGHCGPFFGWVCNTAVDLDSVTVNVDVSPGPDALQLKAGCTGRIGKVTINTVAGDGIKVSGNGGPSDLIVGPGTVTCTAREPVKHQDGIQVLAAKNLTFVGITTRCTTANNAQFFLNATDPAAIQDVLCVACSFHPGPSYHDVTIGVSTRSGVVGSVVCPSASAALTFKSSDATDPVNLNNTFPASC
jgi:hypothetical protein